MRILGGRTPPSKSDSDHTQRDLVKINPQKSDLICYNTSSERKVNIGISRNEKNSNNIDEKLKSGRAAIYGMLGAGLHLRKGFSPLISHNLWKVCAVPKILYGLEVMPIKKKEMEQMEIMQRKLLRPQAHGAWISFPPPPFSLLPAPPPPFQIFI